MEAGNRQNEIKNDWSHTPDKIHIVVCANGSVAPPTGGSSVRRGRGLGKPQVCAGNSGVKETTLEDLFQSQPPPIFAQIEEGLERIESKIGNPGENKVGSLETRINQLKSDPAPLRDHNFDSIVHALCMGFAIVLSFYVLGAIGSAILRALRLMD